MAREASHRQAAGFIGGADASDRQVESEREGLNLVVIVAGVQTAA